MESATLTPPGDEKEQQVVLANIPAVVQAVRINGLVRTKDDMICQHIKKLFSVTNFEDMIKNAQEARLMFERLGLFKSISVSVDVSKGDNAKPDGYEVIYNVHEHRSLTGGISTLVGTNDVNVLFKLSFPNIWGRGETFSAGLTYGTKNATGWSLHLNKPLLANPDLVFQTGILQSISEHPWSGYSELDRGIFIDLTFPTVLGSHSLRWEGTWRHLSCLSKTTSFNVREEAGPSVKSLLRHTWSRDTRDSRVLPSSGFLIRSIQEVAGLGGDANYFKQDAECQLNVPLPYDSSVQLSVAGGIMKPLVAGSTIHIMDRFFLGGPLTLRGFNMKGAGPSDLGCALGANAYWLTGLHLYTPLPFRPGRGGFGEYFRTHFFLGAGNLNTVCYDRGLRENFSDMVDNLRWSYGLGVVLRMGNIARLELNYCFPAGAQKSDSTCPGLQFGIGMTFL